MEGTALFQLPEGMQVDQIPITENGLMIEVVATLLHRVVQSALNLHRRSIATIAGPCVMSPVRAVMSSLC
jgi:hypothetical protein